MSKDRNWFVWRALAALVLVCLLIVGALAVHYVGWSQGYAAGQLTAEGEEIEAPSYLPRVGQPSGFAPYPLRAGLLFKIVLLLFFLAVIGKLIRFAIWGAFWGPAMAGPHALHWRRAYWRHAGRWHRPHGPVPPPYWGWGGPPEEEAAEPDEQPGVQV